MTPEQFQAGFSSVVALATFAQNLDPGTLADMLVFCDQTTAVNKANTTDPIAQLIHAGNLKEARAIISAVIDVRNTLALVRKKRLRLKHQGKP